MTQPHEQDPLPPTSGQSGPVRIQDMLSVPWQGLRPDLVLHPGPVDFDGQRSWVLEDPVRGNNFRLGYAEGELVFRLTTEPDVDAAIRKLYETTTLRPTIQEILVFIGMLQRERLAILPGDEAMNFDSRIKGMEDAGLLDQILHGNIFFRIPLLRPDAFLSRTLPWMSLLWSGPARWFYMICGLIGLGLTLQEIEIYLGSVSYLFTPQGGAAFFICLALLKAGHEFAHAYAAKNMGLHVRSMGILFIVIWPLLYTDTTDVWKIPDRRRRMWVSAAGVLFELAVGGMALLLWAFLPDGIPRSLMFFLSGTSILSSFLVNINPFMRYDGYYLLMDWWGVDNLRPRAFAILRHAIRRILFDWQGPAPEIHPRQGRLMVYGALALLYKLFIGISIAVAVYYLFFPVLGLIIFASEMWMFIIYPFWNEIRMVIMGRQYMGRPWRLALTACGIAGLCFLLFAPLPRMVHVPCLLLYRDTIRVEAPDSGQLVTDMPTEGMKVKPGDLLARLSNDTLTYERDEVRFDLEKVQATIASLGSGGEQGAYRNWLAAEEARLQAGLKKYEEAAAQMEIRASVAGQVMEVNPDIYNGAFVNRGTWLFTVADPGKREVRAYIHENMMEEIKDFGAMYARVRFAGTGIPVLQARLVEKSTFPVRHFPNDSLLDIAKGPVASVQDAGPDGRRRRPRDAWFPFTFEVEDVPPWLVHGMPSWIWLQGESRPAAVRLFGNVWKKLVERGLF